MSMDGRRIWSCVHSQTDIVGPGELGRNRETTDLGEDMGVFNAELLADVPESAFDIGSFWPLVSFHAAYHMGR